MWQEIPVVMEQLKRKGARVIVFRGQGGTFASGADLDELRQIVDVDSAAEVWHSILNCLESIWQFELPVVAMINGSCIGGGCLLATACDFRIATHSSSFEVPVSRFGLLLDDRTIARMVAAGGVPFAKEILIAANTVSAVRAHALGYLVDVVSETGLESATMQLALQISTNVSAAVAACKRSINAAANLTPADSIISDQDVTGSYLSLEFQKRVRPQ